MVFGINIILRNLGCKIEVMSRLIPGGQLRPHYKLLLHVTESPRKIFLPFKKHYASLVYICMCVGMYTSHGTRVWRLVLSFCPMGPGNWTRVFDFGLVASTFTH